MRQSDETGKSRSTTADISVRTAAIDHNRVIVRAAITESDSSLSTIHCVTLPHMSTMTLHREQNLRLLSLTLVHRQVDWSGSINVELH
ncbi:hypothetical protein TNCV_4319111 [Trichonephila clavipes]|nr:hypothetical protein TNCV_4319111 [Trichonephila clavipes]